MNSEIYDMYDSPEEAYKVIQKRALFLRKVFKEVFYNNALQELFSKSRSERKKLAALCRRFMQKECSKCGGGCCRAISIPNESILLYLYFYNTLPEPDWNFLKEKNKTKYFGSNYAQCMFLSRSGCLLQEFRPLICLGYVCGTIINYLDLKRSRKDKILSTIEEHTRRCSKYSFGGVFCAGMRE